MIELKNISKTFYKADREIKALNNVSLHVPKGKIFGVIGTSGAGKSTLIRCINLLEKPTSGDVVIEGKSLPGLSAAQLTRERRQMGMIFQHFNLLSSRTVYQNIAFALELANTPKNIIDARVKELLALVGLDEKINDYPASLSGGQKQRVAIARTLANNPKILLCDEATSALDPATTRAILNLLKDINKRLNITILLITHQMEVVKAICDEVAVISGGELIEQGTVGEIFAKPQQQLTREFIASALHIEIPPVYTERLKALHKDGLSSLVRLELGGNSANEPFITDAARQYDIDIKIISAETSYAGTTSFGILIIEISGDLPRQNDALQLFNQKNIKTELLGYV
ncbi:methionine ABC transporter ATP-binding protein MetN [Flavobacterium psychrotrophum]|uniref:methionine ABC transporter ATP-binding protein MetN n=1 Tax=Flavobacterium psychrotrophum TaxID=2294119 RepID=UPI000E317C67|nr:methionine ABC transporter ATP-binding protein MetN [Flavobacterium psychrotrophum]